MADYTGSFYTGADATRSKSFVSHDLTMRGVLMSPMGATFNYSKRARDSGAPSPEYVYWIATSASGAYPGVPPHGGPLVEETIMGVWEV